MYSGSRSCGKIGCCWMKEEDIRRLHLHISERAVANHNSYDLISGKNVLGTNTYKVCIYRVASWSLLQYILLYSTLDIEAFLKYSAISI